MSRSLSDQLVATGIARNPSSSPAEQHSSSPRNQTTQGAAHPTVSDRLICQLPLWGTVDSWNKTQEYGFLKCDSEPKLIFFHISRRQPDAPRQTLNPNPHAHIRSLSDGEPILFILGADPDNTKALGAVRWARVSDLQWDADKQPHDQNSLDSVRRDTLAALSLDELWSLLRADWYVHLWRNESAPVPADLKDPVLIANWFARITPLSPQKLVQCSARSKLAQSRYGFGDGLSAEKLLDVLSSKQLAVLSTPKFTWMHAAIPGRKSL